MTKHIIFDLDGTLIDSMPVWRNTGKRYLESHNIPIPPNLLSVMKKQTLPQTAEFFRQELGATQTVREICDEVISYVADQYANSIPLKPFVKEFLEREKNKGTKMCILTASEADYIHLALNRLELLPYFEFVATCTEVGASKDSPKVFQMMMERLGGTLEDTVVFEDAYYAIKSAKDGGFTVYAIADPTSDSEKEAISSTADRYILSYEELL